MAQPYFNAGPFNAGSGGGFPLGAAEAQNLASLLGNLMPLLLRIQSLTGDPSPTEGVGGIAAPTPIPFTDQQAAAEFVQDMVARSLCDLASYLEEHAPRHAGLESCTAIVTQAANCYGAGDPVQAFGLVWQAYRQIAALRVGDPGLPAMGTGQAPARSWSPTTSQGPTSHGPTSHGPTSLRPTSLRPTSLRPTSLRH